MPLYMTLGGVFGYGRSHLPPFDAVDFGSFSNWHGATASSIAATAIPNCYNYLFDGTVSTILDGGHNMWNVGNYVSIEGVVTGSNIAYGTAVATAGSGYFVSQSNSWPQVAMAYVGAGSSPATIQWDNAGEVGLFGSPFASNANFNGTYATMNQGRHGSYWVNQKYGLANPTICYLWFTIQDPNVNSVITGSTDGRNTVQPPDYSYTQFFSVTGSRFLFAQMLLSVRDPSAFPNGFLISQPTIENFLSNYVQSADIRLE